MRLPLRKLSKKRRSLLLVVGSILVAAVTVFGYSEYSASQFTERSETSYQNAKREIHHQLSGSDLSLQNIASIGETSEQVAASLCDAPAIASWRVNQSHKAECVQREQRLSGVSQQADSLISYIESSEAIAEIFAKADEALGKVEAGDYKARQKVWRQAEGQLADVSVVQAYQELLGLHRSDVTHVINRYGKLIEADNAKKRSQFDDAATELQDSYDRLSKSSTRVDKAYRIQVEALLDSIERLSA